MDRAVTSEPQKGSADHPKTVSSRDLLGTGRQLIIEHGGERYRLLLTKSNKLILTK